jgi:glutamate dehydrogenase
MDSLSPTPPRVALDDLISLARAKPWPGLSADGGLHTDAAVFLRGYWEDLAPEELRGVAAADVLALADPFWAFGAVRAPGERHVRVRAALGADGQSLDRSVLEIIGDDGPFLVSSIMGEVSEQELTALALVHPIVRVCRDGGGKRCVGDPIVAESYIQVQFETLSEARAQALLEGVRATLEDVSAAVGDYPALRNRMAALADELDRAPGQMDIEAARENVAFLRWLEGSSFVFLGARDYAFAREGDGQFVRDEPIVMEETGLGLLRDPNRFVLRRAAEPSMLTPEIARFLQEPAALVVAKSNLRSRVHRRVAADYIGVKRYDAKGEVIGETRFVGLFTAEAYNEPTREIPLLRQKVRRVLERAGVIPGSHNAKVLANLVETFPRDELFQSTEEDLLTLAQAALHLVDRPRPRALVRRDRFNRFVSVLVYLPKERFTPSVHEQIGAMLGETFGGSVTSSLPTIGEGPLARIHFIVSDIDRERAEPDREALDERLSQISRTWEDRFEAALRARVDDPYHASETLRRYARAFNAAYQERFDAHEALLDIAELDRLQPEHKVRVRAFKLSGDAPNALRCKIYALGHSLPLSACMPVLENMGLFVETEASLSVKRAPPEGAQDGPALWVHDLEMRTASGRAVDLEAIDRCFEDAFEAVWTGRADNDGFNRLIIELGVGWRKAGLIRALARYRQQTGLDPSVSVVEQALADHSDIVRDLLELFRTRFDPEAFTDLAARQEAVAAIAARIDGRLDGVQSLDADRVLRRLSRLILAILRTNFYQRDGAGAPKSYMSFKINSPDLIDLPEPKPYREIWVWAPEVEGVHLRFGPVARGGLRWTDRRDDFRTEVLDLVKAQQVKNAIIVPVGAKGGFFPKLLGRGSEPPRDIAIAAYKIFLRGLLDITDNLVDGAVTAPDRVLRWDNDDPYLVVAADKGTATFSDIANKVSGEYGFWLGDAFASGGSAGYDHKAMGITAKGAWEAVKRHFREAGKDIQSEPFDVIGVGDMSGDVFGNGMLLSKTIRLLAAFDHRDIFLDPNPRDALASWAERKRLYDLPGSRWKDYDKSLISEGGGVFSRQEKTIPLSAPIRELLGIEAAQLSASELLSALLKAKCDLLWFGGIGTYVKAARESHADVGDKANDALRVNAEELGARVIGEGANLGVTQAGRIAFARAGGRINTDAVDNSAGVDTSDHEVNIKILLFDVIRNGALEASAREPLLQDMTQEVGAHVLAHNTNQTMALSMAQFSAIADVDAHERFMTRLERAGRLSRKVEGLPSSEAMRELRARGQGLTRPELSKLLAYAKIDAFNALVAGDAPDDPFFADTLRGYFPTHLARFEAAMEGHRLRREIISTVLADETINWGGPLFIDRIQDVARADPAAVVCAFTAARHIYRADAFAARVQALDNQIPAQAQMALIFEASQALSAITAHLTRGNSVRTHGGIKRTIAAYQPSVDSQRDSVLDQLTPAESAAAEARVRRLREAGAPEDLAREAALLHALAPALVIADLAQSMEWPAASAARLYRAIGAGLGLDRARAAGEDLQLPQHFDRLALKRIQADFNEDQRALALRAAVDVGEPRDNASATYLAQSWIGARGERAQTALRIVSELESTGPWSLAKAILTAAEMRALAREAG